LRYGLLTAATGPLDLPVPHGLGSGVRYQPVSCGEAHLVAVDCDTPSPWTFEAADGYVTASPFLARASYVCSAVGTTPQELETKVRRRLANGEQTVAETGMAVALAATSTPVTTTAPASIQAVVGGLEQWLYGPDGGYGNVGYLHMPARFSAYIPAGLAIKDGPVWRTPMGTVWIFGGGYPDDGTVYISGQVTVWRSAEVHVPSAVEVFDRALNEIRLIADREYAVAFDCVAARTAFIPVVPAS
jgi:hypothetical protein